MNGDGRFHIYYVPLFNKHHGNITQLRVHPVIEYGGVSPGRGQSFQIDFIKIAKAPTIFKVEGCVNKYYNSPDMVGHQQNAAGVNGYRTVAQPGTAGYGAPEQDIKTNVVVRILSSFQVHTRVYTHALTMYIF